MIMLLATHIISMLSLRSIQITVPIVIIKFIPKHLSRGHHVTIYCRLDEL